MSNVAPRTAREFADAGRHVVVTCRCGHEQVIEAEMVIFMLGEDFPLATATAALSAELTCTLCGLDRPAIGFRDTSVHEEDTADFVADRPSRRCAGNQW